MVRAQLRARPYGARQSIFLRKEILFGYLIAFLAQKAKYVLLSHTKIIVNTNTTKLRTWKNVICLYVRRNFSYKWGVGCLLKTNFSNLSEKWNLWKACENSFFKVKRNNGRVCESYFIKVKRNIHREIGGIWKLILQNEAKSEIHGFRKSGKD